MIIVLQKDNDTPSDFEETQVPLIGEALREQ